MTTNTNGLVKITEIIKGKKVLACSLILIFLIVLGVIYLINSNQIREHRSNNILNRLSAIQILLKQVSNDSYNSKEESVVLQNLKDNILSLKKSLNKVATSSDVTKVVKQITSVKDDMDNQMQNLRKIILSSFDKNEYLDVDNLPFHVTSIDIIGGDAFLSINYANHLSLLGIGDELVDWRVVSADYDKGMATLVNNKNQLVRVVLQGIK